MKFLIRGLFIFTALLVFVPDGAVGDNPENSPADRQISPLQVIKSPDRIRKSDGDPNTKDVGQDGGAQLHVITKRQYHDGGFGGGDRYHGHGGGGRDDSRCLYDRDCPRRFQYCDNSAGRGRRGYCRSRRH